MKTAPSRPLPRPIEVWLFIAMIAPLPFVGRLNHVDVFYILGLEFAVCAILARLGGRHIVTQCGFMLGALSTFGVGLYIHLASSV